MTSDVQERPSGRAAAFVRRHLRLRLMLWILLIPAPPLLLTLWFAQQSYSDLADRMRESADLLAGQTATTLGRIVYERDRDSLVFSALPAVRSLDPARLPEVLDQVVEGYSPQYRLVLVADVHGRVLASSGEAGPAGNVRRVPEGTTVADEPWFREAMAWPGGPGPPPIAATGLAPDPLLHRLIGDDTPLLRLSLPIRSPRGAGQAVWTGWVNGSVFLDALRASSKAAGGEAGLVVGLFDREGRPMGFSVHGLPDRLGPPLVERAVPGGGLGWTVRVYADHAAGGSQTPWTIPAIAAIVACIAGGAVLLGWLTTRHILAPMERLAAEAADPGGEGVRFTVEPGRGDAIGTLQRALAGMTAQLDAATAALRREVLERRRSEWEAQTARAGLETLLAEAPDLIVFTDPDGAITRFNHGAEALLGWRETEMVGRSAGALYARPEDRTALVRDVATHGHVAGREVRLKGKDGRVLDVSLTLVRLADHTGLPAGMVGFGRDITAMKRLEHALRTSNEELEHFTFTISHDLQTPLRGIHGFADLLLRRAKDRLELKEVHYLQRMQAGADRMAALINDLLDLSRVGRVRNAFEDCPMGKLVAEARAELEPLIKQRGAHLHVEGDLPVLQGDRVRLLRVWVNLLSNAVKYGKPGEAPSVVVGVQGPRPREGGEEWAFFVRDRGIGIAPDYHEQVFEVFRRLHTHEEYEGTGAGLAIVKRIVEFHRGRVWVESTEGEGSTFWFTLPAGRDHRPPTSGGEEGEGA